MKFLIVLTALAAVALAMGERPGLTMLLYGFIILCWCLTQVPKEPRPQ